MANNFSVVITALRKEHGLSQKQAAESLHVSQALLSHYEKGIRECGLDFIVKVADFYNVTCDYILGRSKERDDKNTYFDGIVNDAENNPDIFKHKRQIFNCLNIIYDITGKLQSRAVTTEICGILSLYIYHILRQMGTINMKDSNDIFGSDMIKSMFLTEAQLKLRYAKLIDLLKSDEDASYQRNKDTISLRPERLEASYPLYAKSMNSLIDEIQKKHKG
ncbi:MAG: hypothetical protein BGN88_03045 [Clostridiales bacterium 43-6]|nr:MAG: hypothetical protein BGN88_03045 [Clostridiales bacterium 43-6]